MIWTQRQILSNFFSCWPLKAVQHPSSGLCIVIFFHRWQYKKQFKKWVIYLAVALFWSQITEVNINCDKTCKLNVPLISCDMNDPSTLWSSINLQLCIIHKESMRHSTQKVLHKTPDLKQLQSQNRRIVWDIITMHRIMRCGQEMWYPWWEFGVEKGQ